LKNQEKAQKTIFELFPDSKGTYALLLSNRNPQKITIGKRGTTLFPPGCLIYIGSAFGPGGLKGRISHHLRIQKHPHWHLDYLRQSIPLSQIWYSENKLVLEHHWASIMSHWDGISIPMKKFGASDCKCSTHLFHLNQPLEFNEFQKKHSDILKQPNDLKQVII
jgi:Uri superfamily endonuclease|tara:strand:- start:2784 stop:3275 length:492 start_codon:yes stop_codon:yes gene_type:complete